MSAHFFLNHQDPVEVSKTVFLQVVDRIRDSLKGLPHSAKAMALPDTCADCIWRAAS